MRLLLVNPRFPESFWSFRWAVQKVLPGRRTINPPLGLATVAALSPADWEVTIVDENVAPIPLSPEADVVGICGMGVQFPRQRELLAYYRRLGYHVVAGGSYASLVPERYADLADTVVAGEAEYTWPEFCRDLERGRPKRLYQETGVVDLRDSPVPRFDLLQPDRYLSMTVQFSRGCPYRCEFCDIIVMFGRRPRTKTPEQVGRELDALRRLGARRVFFVDDNLIGNRKLAKELLRYLARYQRACGHRFHFGTEASLNVAHDAELLELLRTANFGWLFIGIESPDEESLKETRKFQNVGHDILASVRTVYAAGLDVLAGFIIGFDHDTVETFDRQYDFIMRSGIQAAMVGLLTAAERTPLYERLRREGRLIPDAGSTDNVKLATNVRPKGMTYEEMLAGYRALHERLFTDRNIAARIGNKLRYLRRPALTTPHSPREILAISRRFVLHGLVRGGAGRILLFLRSLPWRRPRLLPQVVEDWIVGLSLQDYVERHFRRPEPELVLEGLAAHLERMGELLARYRNAGAVEISLGEVTQAACELSLHLRGHLDRRFFRRTARCLRRLLRQTSASVTLYIEYFEEAEERHFGRFLRRLSRYGDRVRITVDERWRHRIHVDSSVFGLSFR